MSRKDIGKIAKIMKNDFKASFSNPIVTIVLIAIIILPSLYALLNIQACWDPYGNTDQVQFAIANLDKGADYEGTKLNVGNELVKELKNNTKFDWTFVTEDELREGVENGEYYAGIIIPKNLSKNVLSITTDDPKQAELEYIVNVKSNPVATKLTDTAANTVYTKLNAKIVEIINLAAYGKLGELKDGLASGASQLASGGQQLAAGSSQISSGASQVSSGAGQLQEGANQVQQGASQVQEGSSAVSQGADQVKQGSASVTQGANQVQQGSEELQQAVDPSTLPEPMKQYTESNIQLANSSGEVAKGSAKLAEGSVQLAESSSKLADGASDVAGGASQVAGGSVELAEGSLSLAAGAQLLSSSASQALFSAAGALGASANSLGEITGVNESLLGEYFFSPVKLDRHEVFPVPDYGSNVAPFYLVLSMWVGALITCVMIQPKSSVGTEYSPFEMYTGKLFFYVVMSILQACVTIIGAILLGVHITNYPLFIFSAILVSVVFMVLIYSIISAVGNVGKGIAVVLLVLQISATGGIYPIQIMHSFFQTLYPYMPMTYAITLIREAQLGVVWSNYIPALIILLAIGIATVIVAVIIKEKADKASKYFEERLNESGLF
ncbi:YhgE/Pip family protein [Methanobrevibacter sp.]|uniref:YhgE/Pip family protein n=1 Tax=Methanobrevibacter sp. TaxID=66852 RepID=UPI00388E28A0